MIEDAQSSFNYSNIQGCVSVMFFHLYVSLQLCSDSNFCFCTHWFTLSISRNHPPPTFGSSPHLEALALQASKYGVEDGDSALHATPCFSRWGEKNFFLQQHNKIVKDKNNDLVTHFLTTSLSRTYGEEANMSLAQR